MKILFTGRKTRPNRALRTFAEEKLSKLERVLDVVLEAHVILTLEKHRRQAEIIVKARTATLTARGEEETFQDAVLACVDRLMAQAKKHRDRQRQRRKRAGARSRIGALAAPAGGTPSSGDGRDRARVVRMGRIPAKPMSLDEALLQVRGSRDPFVVFLNSESQQIAVLYRRPDGRFGLVETEA